MLPKSRLTRSCKLHEDEIWKWNFPEIPAHIHLHSIWCADNMRSAIYCGKCLCMPPWGGVDKLNAWKLLWLRQLHSSHALWVELNSCIWLWCEYCSMAVIQRYDHQICMHPCSPLSVSLPWICIQQAAYVVTGYWSSHHACWACWIAWSIGISCLEMFEFVVKRLLASRGILGLNVHAPDTSACVMQVGEVVKMTVFHRTVFLEIVFDFQFFWQKNRIHRTVLYCTVLLYSPYPRSRPPWDVDQSSKRKELKNDNRSKGWHGWC